MKAIGMIPLICILACASCGQGPLDAIERSSLDPGIVAPTVVSFAAEKHIGVSWPEDPCADEYVLETASGSVASPAYSVAYRGRANEYGENACADQSLRLFRLIKIRGDRRFGPSDAAMGVGSAVTRDAQEPNDHEAQATDLGYERCANLYYYRSYEGIAVEDADWYSMDIPPRMVAYIVVAQTNPTISGQADTWMSLYQPGLIPVVVKNNTAIPLYNYAYSAQRIFFEIIPRVDFFIGVGGPAGGSMMNYTVKLYQTQAIGT